MKHFEYCYHGENIYAGGRQYRAGDLLVSYMNLNIERLDALYSACVTQKNILLRFERSEEYSRNLHRCADTFDVVDKLLSRLTPYNRLGGEDITLLSLIEKSPLFRGFDVISADSGSVETWRRECESLCDMYLSALDALKFCRDTAAPFLEALEDTADENAAFERIGADGIEIVTPNELLVTADIGGSKKLCRWVTEGSFLSFVQTAFCLVLNAETKPRPCGCCGKYFLPSNNLAKFCERKAPDGSGKLCREVGARRRYEKKQKDNPISTAYTRVYKARYARMTNGKMTKDEMNQWTERAVQLRSKAMAENMPADEFELQLKAL